MIGAVASYVLNCSLLISYLLLSQPTEADVARSILTMMSFNVAQQAYLNSVIYNCSRYDSLFISVYVESSFYICECEIFILVDCLCYRIVLVGYYLEMPGYLSSIQHCIDFWSGGKCTINFVR